MASSTSLTEQLTYLGIDLPAWPEEPEVGGDTDDWIQRGKAYAEGLRLWRAQLRNAPESTKVVVDHVLRHLHDNGQLGAWDQLVHSVIEPALQDLQSTREHQRYTDLIHSPALTQEQLLGATLHLAHDQQIAEACSGLQRLLKEHPLIGAKERQRLCSEMISHANTSDLMLDAEASLTDWDCALTFYRVFTEILASSIAEEIECLYPERAESKGGIDIMRRIEEIGGCLERRSGIENIQIPKASFMEIADIKTYGFYANTAKEINPSDLPPEYLLIYAGHIRSFQNTRDSHLDLTRRSSPFSRTATIIHTWSSKYPDTISWRGHIQHNDQIENDALVQSISDTVPNYEMLSIDRQLPDSKYLNREEHTDQKLEGMHYGSRFFRYSRLCSIYMGMHYAKALKIPGSTKVILLRPDVSFKEGWNLPSEFADEAGKPYFLYNKLDNDNTLKATDCVWLCTARHLELIYAQLLNSHQGLITLPQTHFAPCPDGNYNHAWSLYR